jgi:hypothetical protein
MLWFRELECGAATQPIQGILIFKNNKAKYLYCRSICTIPVCSCFSIENSRGLGPAFLFCSASKGVHQDPTHIKNTSSLLKTELLKPPIENTA